MIDAIDHLKAPVRPAQEEFVPTSLQFSITGLKDTRIERFLEEADAHGVHVKWFGASEPIGFTSRHVHWRYLNQEQAVPKADQVLKELCDIRLPLSLTPDDCSVIATVLREAMAAKAMPQWPIVVSCLKFDTVPNQHPERRFFKG